MDFVGYLVNTKDGLEGEQGMAYDYILAENGLFIQAKGPLLVARIPIAHVKVRGLAPVDRKVELVHGGIHPRIYDLALSILSINRRIERYLAVTWENDEYHLKDPWQDGGGGGVDYEVIPNRILDIHSHGSSKLEEFSFIDNMDELGLRLYAVVGRLHELLPSLEIRVGIYGYFASVKFEEIFYV